MVIEILSALFLIFAFDNFLNNRIINIEAKQTDNRYIIRITPENGAIDPKDINFTQSNFAYDLIILVGVPNLQTLGDFYHHHTEIFFELPKINIDNHNNNENYGQINLTDLTAGSVAEIIAEQLVNHAEHTLNRDIAQALLTGIIASTESFQKANTTPTSMIIAAKLMKFRADQPTIIRHLYRTKSMSLLKLWGRVLTNLKWNPETSTVICTVSRQDITQSNTSENDLPEILENLKKEIAEAAVFLLFYEKDTSETNLFCYFQSKKQARNFTENLNHPFTENTFSLTLPNNLPEAQKKIMTLLENQN